MKLYELVYGTDGDSGLIGELRNNGEINEEKFRIVKDYINDLVKKKMKDETFPKEDVATLCDLFTDLTANTDLNPAVADRRDELNDLIQEWYDD